VTFALERTETPRLSDAVRRSGDRLPATLLGICVALIPILRPVLPGNSAAADPLLLVAVLVVLIWARSVGARLHLPYAFPMGISIIAGALGAIAGRFPGKAGLALGQDIFLLVWAGVIVTACRTPGALRTVLKWWAITAIGWALLLLAAVNVGATGLAGEAANNGGRAALTFRDPNLAASYFVPSLAILWATSTPRALWLRIVATAALLAALLYTGSNGGLIALGVLVAVVALVKLARRATPIMALAVGTIIALAAGGALLALSPQSLATKADRGNHFLVDSLGRATESVGTRQQLFKETLSMYRNDSLLGNGPGTTQSELSARQAPYVKEAHNDYTAALAERGILGGFALVLLFANVGARCARLRPRRLRPEWRAVVPYPEYLIGAVLGFATSGFFYEVLHFRHLWLLLAVIATLGIHGSVAPTEETA
jgi:O-antigen ligase